MDSPRSDEEGIFTGSAAQEPTSRRVVSCDGCEATIRETRYKCQDCPNFDYCTTCFREASTIHPTHTFAETALPEEAISSLADNADEEGDEKDPILLESGEPFLPSASSTAQCRCCYTLTWLLSCTPWMVPQEHKGKMITLRWRLRVSSLIEATQRGCSFCAFILGDLFGDSISQRWMTYKPSRSWYSSPSKHDAEREKLVETWMSKLTKLGNDPIDMAVVVEFGSNDRDLTSIRIALGFDDALSQEEKRKKMFAYGIHAPLRLKVLATEGSTAAEYLTSRPPNPAPGSASSMQQMREWARDCEENHALCRGPDSKTVMPSRVLDVSGDDLVRIHETAKDEQGRYATLSYCWGGPQECQTTRANLAERLHKLNVDDLPQTLQDAIFVTRQLGIDYLWIDSMCIVQDDLTDKQAEIDQMGTIYQNSAITICASREHNVNGGFLEDWSDPETGLWPGLIPLPYLLLDKTADTMEAATQLPIRCGTIWLGRDDGPMGHRFPSPLARRGWCLQERILSPRIMEFGRWPAWRCLANNGSKKDKPDKELRLTRLISTLSETNLDMFTLSQLYKDWYKTVEGYSRTDLGDKADRLPAIGGIASRMSAVTGIEYMAGLWRNNMLHDLMWTCTPGEWGRRGSSWRAPTWSWASVDGPVSYSPLTDDATPLAQILRCQVEPGLGAGTVFGLLADGIVSIRGLASQVGRDVVLSIMEEQKMAPAPPKSNDMEAWDKALMEFTFMLPRTTCELDTLPGDEFLLLLTFERDWYIEWEETVQGTCLSGLILRAVEGRYERIGAFVNHWKGLDNIGWEQQTVDII